jgi:VWFA-related protein
VKRPPYECDWDAGPKIVEHQIRVVANLVGGGRVVSNARTKGITFAESVEVDVVQITATVTDGHGHFVKDLPKSLFHVFEDGTRQTISHFSGDDSPLELVVAIDTSNSMTPWIVQLKAAVSEFLTAIPARERVTLLAFNSSIATLATQTTNLAERSAAVDQLTPAGTTVLYDTIIRGTDMLGTKSGRKALVVFTDGEDEGSHAPIEEVERRLEASDVTLFMVGLGRGASFAPLKQIMLRLTQPTGGRALFTEKIEELKTPFHDLLEELSHQYLLGYESSNQKRDGTFRRIKVDVDGRYQVRARQGYRAPSR